MKRIISLLLVFVLLISGCSQGNTASESLPAENNSDTQERTKDDSAQVNVKEESASVIENENASVDEKSESGIQQESNDEVSSKEDPEEEFDLTSYREFEPNYSRLSDPDLLRYIEDNMYAEMVSSLDSEEYFVQNINAIYLSKEYIEELEYNSQENIFFGYTLSELDAEFQGTRYVFTLSEDGETVVKPFEGYDDTYEKVLKNVAIGTGVILVCVTVSVVTAGAGAPAVSMIFAASAKTGTVMAVSSGAMGGIAAGITTGIQTKDFDQAVKAATLAGSEGFKMGAISGAIAGGASEAVLLKGATMNGLTMNEAAIMQKKGYPLDVIKQFNSMEQFEVCEKAGLKPGMIDGKSALLREIDLKQVDEAGLTNAQRIAKGQTPLDPDGIPYELHHVGQKVDSTLAILTKEEHRLRDMNKVWHKVVEAGEGVHSQNPNWPSERVAFWRAYLELYEKGLL